MTHKNSQNGFVGILAIATAAVVFGGIFYFVNKSNNNSHFTLETNNMPAMVIQSTHEDVPITPDLTVSTTTQTIKGLALATDTHTGPIVVVNQPKKQKLVVDTGTPESTKVEKITAPVTVEKEVSEPTLFIETGTQPTSTLLLADARRVPFTVIELTAKGGDITINNLVLERKGLASDRIFTEVGVIDMGSERALNANHQYTMKDSFTIKDGETQEVVLYGNVTDIETLAEYEGQMASLALVSVGTSAKISGSLPIVGPLHTVNSNLVIGSLETQTSGIDPGVNKNIDVNTNNTIFSSVRLNAGSAEPLFLKFFGWTQNGSASSNDIKNVQICAVYKANTNCFDTTLDSDGKYYYSEFDNEVQIAKGESLEVYIKGDVGTTGSSRTIDFDLNTSYDIMALGRTYNNYIYSYGGVDEGSQPEGSFSVTEYPFYNGFAHTIVSGSISSFR